MRELVTSTLRVPWWNTVTYKNCTLFNNIRAVLTYSIPSIMTRGVAIIQYVKSI